MTLAISRSSSGVGSRVIVITMATPVSGYEDVNGNGVEWFAATFIKIRLNCVAITFRFAAGILPLYIVDTRRKARLHDTTPRAACHDKYLLQNIRCFMAKKKEYTTRCKERKTERAVSLTLPRRERWRWFAARNVYKKCLHGRMRCQRRYFDIRHYDMSFNGLSLSMQDNIPHFATTTRLVTRTAERLSRQIAVGHVVSRLPNCRGRYVILSLLVATRC